MISIILTCALAQYGGPVTGWNEPIWEGYFDLGIRGYPEVFEDFTGDGVPEILVRYFPEWGSFQILDGANGSVWFELEQPGAHNLSHEFLRDDLDGDGLPELIFANQFSYTGYGTVAVVHGGDGQLMWQVWGHEDGDELGRFVELLDMDGDGLNDLFVPSGPNGKAVALSGLTGDILWRHFGLGARFISSTPDINGDGTQDLIIGGHSRLTALSGNGGAAIWTRPTSIIEGSYQWQSLYHDFNQDGTPDIVILSPRQDFGSLTSNGAIEVRNGRNGALLWEASGTASNMGLGTNAFLEDRNGDGVDDLMSLHVSHQTLLDGQTGAIIWEHTPPNYFPTSAPLRLMDFTGDSYSDVLVPSGSSSGTQMGLLELLDGVDGTVIWSLSTQWPGEHYANLTLADFDQDGVTDILAMSEQADVVFNGTGLLRVFSGVDGQEIWQRSGEFAGDALGRVVIEEEIDAVSGPDLLLLTTSTANPRKRFSVNGITGLDIWSQDYPLTDLPFEAWGSADLDGDGLKDAIEVQWDGEYRSRIVGISSQDGSEVWTIPIQTETRDHVSLVTSLPDVDGDGIDDLVLQFHVRFSGYWLKVHSGADGGYTTGLTMSADQISVSNGGTIQTDIHFPPDQVDWNYQLLLSETGNQLTNLNGLLVPLSPGFWLTSTYMGTYPSGLFTAPTGSLDSSGNASITLDALPNQIASAFIGTTMYAAVISAEPGSSWSFSSGSAAVEILP